MRRVLLNIASRLSVTNGSMRVGNDTAATAYVVSPYELASSAQPVSRSISWSSGGSLHHSRPRGDEEGGGGGKPGTCIVHIDSACIVSGHFHSKPHLA